MAGSEHPSDAAWRARDQYRRDKRRRARAMPTEADALEFLRQAYTRLCELGWQPGSGMPTDGTGVVAIQPPFTELLAASGRQVGRCQAFTVLGPGHVRTDQAAPPMLFRPFKKDPGDID